MVHLNTLVAMKQIWAGSAINGKQIGVTSHDAFRSNVSAIPDHRIDRFIRHIRLKGGTYGFSLVIVLRNILTCVIALGKSCQPESVLIPDAQPP